MQRYEDFFIYEKSISTPVLLTLITTIISRQTAIKKMQIYPHFCIKFVTKTHKYCGYTKNSIILKLGF